MGLKPLEFSDCLLDSPYFRESIHDHEKELDHANDAMKALIKECRNLIKALKDLSKAQVSFNSTLQNFKIRYIGEIDTDEYELEYENSFREFAEIFQKVEEERERMLFNANLQLIEPLEKFRKEQIGQAKEEKRKFDRETERVCGLIENHLKISPKKKDNALQEADSQLEHELLSYRETSLGYVTKLQEVNEKKKFELVENLLSYMLGQVLFYHNGHEVFEDNKIYLNGLQVKLQNTRDRFDVTKNEADDLKNKTKRKFISGELNKAKYAREGYLLVHDRRKSVLGAQWVKHYCMYTKENKILTMVPYVQTNLKVLTNTDTLVVTSCVRKTTETSDRRFLFDITGQDRNQPLTLQSMSEEDRRQWLEAMEGKEPIYLESSELHQAEGVTKINDTGIEFVTKCMEAVETNGINDQGIYRIAGVSSKFNKLLNVGIDPKQIGKLDLVSENSAWDIKTITSAMKQYFRNLSEPIFTFKHHHAFLSAIKLETEGKKIERLKELVKMLPDENHKILHRLMYHLKQVAEHSSKNLMQESNIGVVLGPTLMRPKEETMAAIMSIKFQSLVIETIIKNYHEIFGVGQAPYTKNGNNNNVSLTLSTIEESAITQPSPTAPRKPKTPEFNSSPKYRAPGPPQRPTALPKKSIESDKHVNEKPSIAERPQSTSSQDGFRYLKKQLSAPTALDVPRISLAGARPAIGGRITNSISEADVDKQKVSKSSDKPSPPLRTMSEKRTVVKPAHPPPPKVPKRKEWKVRALYDCIAENPNELSFNKDAIISNVRASTEEGWLIGMLNGKTGMIPENYCDKID